MIKHIYPERESKFLEFKSKLPEFGVLIKTCIAFGNASGGRIVIGVDDNSREIIGASEHDIERLYNDFQNSLFDSVHPNLYAEIYQQNYDSKTVAIIEVPLYGKKPFFLKSIGMAKGTYIRLGSSTRKANDEYIADLIRESERKPYDEELIHESVSILDKELLKNFYGENVTKKILCADKIIGHKSANREKHAPTITGALFFSGQPQRYIPEAIVICTEFKGSEGRDIIRTEEITGPIPLQSENAFRLIRAWTERNYTLVGTKLVGKLPVPAVALREAIANALIHRKYTIPGATKIAIYANRIEIFSPGCFPGLVDINTLGDGITYLRNPNVAQIARKIGLVEKFGTGIKLIFEECRKARIRAPTYHEEGDFVKIIFFFEPDLSITQDDDEAIITLLEMNDSITASDVANMLNITRTSAARKLTKLCQVNKISRTGKGPATRYLLPRKV